MAFVVLSDAVSNHADKPQSCHGSMLTSGITSDIAAKLVKAVSNILVLVEVRKSCIASADNRRPHYNLHRLPFSKGAEL